MLSRSSRLRDILSKTMSDHETEADNLDKTAYDVRKKKIEDLFGSFFHICTSSYFFVQI